MIRDYIIVHSQGAGCFDALAAQVSQQLILGWVPQGGVCHVETHDFISVSQAMILPSEHTSENGGNGNG